MWDVPLALWDKWTPQMFQIFEVVVPKPGLLFSFLLSVFVADEEGRNIDFWNGT